MASEELNAPAEICKARLVCNTGCADKAAVGIALKERPQVRR